MKSLVTGGAGFIGGHLVDSLCERNDDVYNIDKDSPRLGAKKHTYMQGNIVYQNFKTMPRFDVIYHLAARPWSQTSGKDWIHEQQNLMHSNITGTLRIINHFPTDLFVFASTANLYGSGRKFKEDDPFDISSPYGYSKAVDERIIALSGIPYVMYRFGTVVGARGRCFPNRLVWSAINGGGIPVQIFNNGNTYRDIIDVRDVVRAMMSAKDLEQGIYNISSGTEISGANLAFLIEEIANERGYTLNYEFVDWAAPGYVPYSTLDISKIKSIRVWEPQHPLRDTINSLFDYYEQPGAIEPPHWSVI